MPATPFRTIILAMQTLLQPLAVVQYAAKTLLLFTYTDYKTIFVPISMFACVAAPVYSFANLLRGFAWIWFHLLQCNTSNQRRSAEEDAVNRPWRPIPAGRISEENVFYLRGFLIPFCIGLSAMYGWDVAAASAGLTITTIVYDEFELAGHWVGKNFMNIFGYTTFEIGATKIMGHSRHMDWPATQAVLCSAIVIFTTIQAQDFSDVEGDAMLGRLTFPMSYPRFSRWFTLGAMMCWSVFLSQLWELGALSTLVFCALGTYVGLRFFRLREVKDDEMSYKIYNIWLVLLHVLPAQKRWSVFSV